MSSRFFIGFEVVVGLLLFLPPLLSTTLWWPDNRVVIAVILSCMAYVLASASSKEWARRMAFIIGGLAIFFSWYRMGQSYESGLNLFIWLFPVFLLGLSIADLGVILIRRVTKR